MSAGGLRFIRPRGRPVGVVLTRPRQAMPAPVRRALTERGLLEAYRARPPYQRNDYLAWIKRAKREETRARRLAQMLDELEAGDRYMGMAYRPAKAPARAKPAKEPWGVAPDAAAVRAYYAALDLPVRALARSLDALVREELPGVKAGVKWRVPFYFLKGPVCYVSAARRHVTFGLLQGDAIPDETGLLTGTGKSPIRKATLRVGEALPEAAVRAWLREARRADAAWGAR